MSKSNAYVGKRRFELTLRSCIVCKARARTNSADAPDMSLNLLLACVKHKLAWPLGRAIFSSTKAHQLNGISSEPR